MLPDSLESWLSYLETLHPVEIDLGLQRIHGVADRMGLLSPSATVITVAGTNGKGSTCALLDSMLRSAGYRVGVYSSPHLRRYNERILIDGAEASNGQIVGSFSDIEAARGSTSLSYFEFSTLAALDLFRQSSVDVIVLEVGLGGRLDAVNILDADVAVVTTIAVDHEQWLGSDINGIGREKAGVFRKQRPAIYGAVNGNAGVFESAQTIDAMLLRRGIDFDLSLSHDTATNEWHFTGTDFTGKRYHFRDLPLPSLPLDNAATAIFALLQLPLKVPEKAIREGLQSATLPGRFQRVLVNNSSGKPVHVLLDVAHNPQSAEFLKNRLLASPVEGKTHCVLAMLDDKDVVGVLTELQSVCEYWFVSQCDTQRACPTHRLCHELQGLGCDFITSCSSVGEALVSALDTAMPEDRVVVAGSFFTVADALTMIEHSHETAD